MSYLWVPEEARVKMAAEVASLGEAVRVTEFRNRLRAAFGNRMDCFIAEENSPDGDLRMGFWYVTRANEDGTFGCWEINDGGVFREPDERDIEAFRQFDFHNPARAREWKERRDRKLAEREREKARAREDKQGKLDELITYATRLQVAPGRKAA